MLMLDGSIPYDDAKIWSMWHKDARKHLPEPRPDYAGNPPEDDHEYELHYRLAALDALKQQSVGEMRTLLFKDRQLVADKTHTLTSNYYFRNELRMLLEKAGFTIEAEKGDWAKDDAAADHDCLIYFARK